jgi:hypothetical protein
LAKLCDLDGKGVLAKLLDFDGDGVLAKLFDLDGKGVLSKLFDFDGSDVRGFRTVAGGAVLGATIGTAVAFGVGRGEKR